VQIAPRAASAAARKLCRPEFRAHNSEGLRGARGRRRWHYRRRDAPRLIADDEPFDRAIALALQWAGDAATIHAPDTASIEENDLEDLGIPVTSPSSKSRFHGHPRGTVVVVRCGRLPIRYDVVVQQIAQYA
jgi:hypothetical protein